MKIYVNFDVTAAADVLGVWKSPKSPKLIRLAIDPEADLTDDCIITILKRPFCATKKLFRKRRSGGYSFLVRYSSKRFSKWSWKIKGRTTEKTERYRRKKSKEIYGIIMKWGGCTQSCLNLSCEDFPYCMLE
ncbi:uncharacterized protein LOC134235311 isoform X2 [Saccostrea cucullata]|uniref:uncharacterized protein LOC134235311 isoform X2 n=1 Tax=Saccostrea cuccullata TaxID=36930 RepID=UPI002ED33625